MCSMTGRSSTGTMGFVISYVSGRRRVPSPAARTIARIGPRAVCLVTVVVGLVRTVHRHSDVGGLLVGELRQLDSQRVQVKAGDLLVEVLGQHVDPLLILVVLGEQLDLSDRLV